MIKSDTIYWITDEGCKWLVEEVENLTVEDALEYAKRTDELAKQLVEGWRRNGEETCLTICFDIGSLFKSERCKREREIDAALTDSGFQPCFSHSQFLYY